MFLYYLINIWKTKQSWLKKTLSCIAGLAHLCMSLWKIFISPGWHLGKIKWDLTFASWLSSHMNALYYYNSFFKEGEISPRRASPPNRASSPSYEQPLSSPFLYCIVAYQNVSKRIISILTNHIIWITSLRCVIFNIQVEIGL